MKFFHCKIIFLLTLFCVQNQWAGEAKRKCQLTDNQLQLDQAIKVADSAFMDKRVLILLQAELVYEAIVIRKSVLKGDDEMSRAAKKAHDLYFEECRAQKRNHVTEVLYSQAIIAFLQGQLELGNKYISEVDSIKKKQSEKKSTLLESLNQYLLEGL